MSAIHCRAFIDPSFGFWMDNPTNSHCWIIVMRALTVEVMYPHMGIVLEGISVLYRLTDREVLCIRKWALHWIFTTSQLGMGVGVGVGDEFSLSLSLSLIRSFVRSFVRSPFIFTFTFRVFQCFSHCVFVCTYSTLFE